MTLATLDTNIYAKIVDSPGIVDDLAQLVAEGELRVLAAHVQTDERAATPDPVKLGQHNTPDPTSPAG